MDVRQAGQDMRVAIASDHGGFRLKSDIVRLLGRPGHNCRDFGSQELDDDDYPDYAVIEARAVASGEYDRGILICGTGQGMAITANKITGIRAAVCHDIFSAQMSRQYNDANVLCLGERVVGSRVAANMIETWLPAMLSDEERHRRRVTKIMYLDKE